MTAADGAILQVRVIPRAGRTELIRRPSKGDAGDGESLVVRLAAAPVDGAANLALIVFLARLLDVPRNGVTITSGERSRNKRVRFSHLTPQQLASRLSALVPR